MCFFTLVEVGYLWYLLLKATLVTHVLETSGGPWGRDYIFCTSSLDSKRSFKACPPPGESKVCWAIVKSADFFRLIYTYEFYFLNWITEIIYLRIFMMRCTYKNRWGLGSTEIWLLLICCQSFSDWFLWKSSWLGKNVKRNWLKIIWVQINRYFIS